MNQLREWMHEHPYTLAVTVATLAVLAYMVSQGVYWSLAQADPQIIERGQSYFHRGVTLEGRSLAQWRAEGGTEASWYPAPVMAARPGESLWLRRDLEFTNKTLATVTRALRCEGGFQFDWPAMPPPTRTSARMVKHFPVTIPERAAGVCVYEVAAIFYKNPSQPEIRVAFQPVAITVTP